MTGPRALLAPAAVVAGAGLCCAGLLLADPTSPGGPIPTCPTKAYLGVVCPGCGALRMLYSLLHGDLGAALRYNAIGLLAVLLLGWSLVAWTAGRWRGRPVRGWQHWRWAPIACGLVIGLWFLVRNLPFPPFEQLRV